MGKYTHTLICLFVIFYSEQINHLIFFDFLGTQCCSSSKFSVRRDHFRMLNVFFYCRWFIDMEGASGTLYEGEKFQLLFKFSNRYPFDSPQVMFTGENIPVHPHVYSNGHICLSILTEDWSPALSVQSVCLSIISMLSSCKEKRRPPDNSFYVRTCNKNPKKTKWWYHDDTC
uniref:N-terminal E2 ubiquitin-conjugating enzyme n=1 Tax=Astyanax mexicanus TaxID=7994 RepID=A0A8B9LS45_ASTMX